VTYMTSVRNAEPGVDLITTAQAKRWVRRDDDDDVEDIDLLIASAMSHLDGIDGILRRALINQEWIDVWNGFPVGDRLPLALAPVSAVSSVSYSDENNSPQTLASGTYSLHRDFSGSYLRLASGGSWPATYERDDAVTVTYTAGYGAGATDVPAEIRLAARELILDWYGSEGDRPESLPAAIMTKLRRFIRPHF